MTVGAFYSPPSIIPVTTLKASLISCWELDEASGTTAYDSHASNDLTNNAPATVNQTGKLNKAYDFVSANLAVLVSATQLITGFPFTVVFWINTDTSSVNRIATNVNGNNYYGVSIAFDQVQLVMEFGNGVGSGSPNRKTYLKTLSSTAGTWYHVIVYVSAHGVFNFYINNVLTTGWALNSGTATSTNFSTGTIHIGENWGSGGFHADCLYDQVAFWDRELTAAERAALYNAGNGLAYTSW